jgi:hypothetical protein
MSKGNTVTDWMTSVRKYITSNSTACLKGMVSIGAGKDLFSPLNTVCVIREYNVHFFHCLFLLCHYFSFDFSFFTNQNSLKISFWPIKEYDPADQQLDNSGGFYRPYFSWQLDLSTKTISQSTDPVEELLTRVRNCSVLCFLLYFLL